jgi:hypothetical protein
LLKFAIQHGFYTDIEHDIKQILSDIAAQNWPNAENFTAIHIEIISKSEFQKLL